MSNAATNPANPWATGLNQDQAWAKAKEREKAEQTKEKAVKNASARGDTRPVAQIDPYTYRWTLACGQRRVADVSGAEDAGVCRDAMRACQFRNPPSDGPMYLLWQRLRDRPGDPWIFAGEVCRPETLPPNIPPPPRVPSLARIQTAFKALPFSKPSVSVQPVGNVTLVNLPTYYEADWPGDSGLEPGETSQPVKLLSWTIEFKIQSHSYNFHYGDGTSSGATDDPGGTYPDGRIRHTYTKPITAALVRVDARLTGQYRVNGGEWIDLDTVADLQDEPVTTLQVKEARARLVTE